MKMSSYKANRSTPLSPNLCIVLALAMSTLLDVSWARAQDYTDDSYNYYYNYNTNGGGAAGGEYLSDWSQNEWGKVSGRSLQTKCVDIPSNLTLCHNIGYKQMLLPNILDHDSLTEVIQQASSWVHLVNLECHPDLRVFLCSLFSPVCLEKLIYPCRSLCEGVQAACVNRIKHYGFGWPEMLKCDKFPMDNDMCIKLINEVKPDNNCTACKHPLTHEAMIDHYCRSDVAMRVNVKEFRTVLDNKEIVLQNKKTFFKDAGLSKSNRPLVAVIEGGASCTCQTINSTTERYLLMGNKKDDKIIVKFGMAWNKKDKEFKKGFKAIRKGNICEGIFRELVANGVEQKTPGTPVNVTGGKDAGKNKNKNKKGGKNQKNVKKVNKNKKGNKKGKKDKEKEKEKDKKGKRGNKEKGKSSVNSASRRDTVSKSELEDRALSNFMKVAN